MWSCLAIFQLCGNPGTKRPTAVLAKSQWKLTIVSRFSSDARPKLHQQDPRLGIGLDEDSPVLLRQNVE